MVIYSKSHIQKHKCTAALICCIDFRFWKATVNFVQNAFGIYDFDLITHAGAAKVFVEKKTDVINILEKQIRLAERLHKVSMIIIVNHQDCGAYGGSGKFKNEKDEFAHHSQDVRKGIDLLKKKHKEIKFVGLFAYFNKLGGIDFKRLD
tara:strand:+ start:526 stop:972 length:447 start_codon:yes stop_codon:yes gene_type:complete